MIIIGIGGSDHNVSSCLLEDGELKVYIEEERLSKEKHGNGVKSSMLKSVDYCLEYMGLKYEDVDYFVSNDLYCPRLNNKKDCMNKLIRINHHLAHMASAYYLSGFDQAAIFVSDGSGSVVSHFHVETMTLGFASNKCFKVLDKIYGSNTLNPESSNVVKGNSFGRFYSKVSNLCGFELHNDGKLMGLASYGTPRFVNLFRSFFRLTVTPYGLDVIVDFDAQFKDLYKKLYEETNEEKKFQLRADYAYAAQALIEEKTYEILNYLYEKSKCPNLCYAGGTALNSVLNGKIKKMTPFDYVYIPPVPNDSGTAIGAALYGYYNLFTDKKPTYRQLNSAFWGRDYDKDSYLKAIYKYGDRIIVEEMYSTKSVVDDLIQKRVIGWYQGRSEVGPRALGNRSILADPRHAEMKDIINSKVKFRESFRPFAPIVMEEHVLEYFDTDFIPNPFMLYVGLVKEEKKELIPAVTHVDGTARLQTLNQKESPKLYDVLSAFYKRTGVSVLLNTSFNTKGKPMVETPMDAIECMLSCGMDVLYLGNYRITKRR